MGYYLPSIFQKRILRYAISKIGLLDTDALDLEKLDIAWGKRSSFELRDVGLQLDKLTALLRLPDHLTINRAKILLLRVTIPSDIYNSGIVFEAEGIRVEACVNPEDLRSPDAAGHKRQRSGLPKGTKATSSRNRPSKPHDPAGSKDKVPLGLGNATSQDEPVPTTENLAHSYLDAEAAQAKEELKAAPAKSQALEQSQLSESGDFEPDEGLGPTLSLPGFVADFLKGIKARAQAKIKDVQLELALKLDLSTLGSDESGSANLETIKLQFTIGEISVEELATSASKVDEGAVPDFKSPRSMSNSTGKRQISVKDIQANLLSEASLFTFLSQTSGPPSPVTTHANTFPRSLDKKKQPADPPGPSSALQTAGKGSDVKILGKPTLSNQNKPVKTISTDAGKLGGVQIAVEDEDKEAIHDLMHSLDGSQAYAGNDELSNEATRTSSPSQSLLVESEIALGTTEDSFFSQSEFSGDDELLQQLQQQQSPEEARSDGNNSPLEYMSAIGSTISMDFPRKEAESQDASRTFTTPPQEGSANDADDSAEIASSYYHDSSPIPNEMTESRIYSHEEAESMYQSAITHASFSEARNKLDQESLTTPTQETEEAGTSSEPFFGASQSLQDSMPVDPSIETGSRTNVGTPPVQLVTVDSSEIEDSTHSDTQTRGPRLRGGKEGSFPEDDSPNPPLEIGHTSQDASSMIKTFISITSIIVQVPEETAEYDANRDTASGSVNQKESTMIQIPGGFSQSTMISSQRIEDLQRRKLQDHELATKPVQKAEINSQPISIFVERIVIATDMSLTRMAILAAQQLPSSSAEAENEIKNETTRPALNLSIQVRALEWNFVALLQGRLYDQLSKLDYIQPESTPEAEILLKTKVESFSFCQFHEGPSLKRDIAIGKLIFGYEDEPILSFDSSLRMRESVRDVLAPVGQDIKITSSGSLDGTSDFTIMTLPLYVKLDLTRLDETFSWFGGLSGMLELGNSMMSTVTITDPKTNKPNIPEKPRGVRFETPSARIEPSAEVKPTSQLKITTRIGGIVLDLHGRNSSVNIEGTAVKLVVRSGRVGVRIDRVRFKGPILDNPQSDPAITARLDTVKLDYLPLPTDDDLDRLLVLLSPSNDRDDAEDDILLETFLRQRRQGGVLRLNVEAIEGSVGKTQELSHLAAISEELKKLSTMARYLPDDDRPGVLTLAQIDYVALGVDLGGRMGTLQTQAFGVQLAQVTLPSLLLVGVDSLGVQHNGQELAGEVLQQSRSAPGVVKESASRSPMVMARFIGDELEPTLKIKLWNLRLEYHISTLMTILGITETATGEIIVTDMVSSVATLTAQRSLPRSSTQSSTSSGKSSITKLLKFDIAIRDTMIGLNPRGSPARGLVVFTKAKLLGTFPKMDDLDLGGSLEISKMSFLIIDDISNIEQVKERIFRSTLGMSDRERDQVETLSAMGFVSVSEISSAKVNLQMNAAEKGAERSLEIDISDDLFVLETCADSTQTLQAIFNGLKPPMPPSTELKYRTEVVPVQDMLASFTGDAFPADAAEGDDTDYNAAVSESEFMDVEGTPNLEFVSSFYEPNPKVGREATEDSMLEEGLSHFGLAGQQKGKTGQPLLSSFREQTEMADDRGPLSFNEEHFGSGPAAGGTTHQWNSNRNAYDLVNEPRARGSPFQLRLCDVHIIWNLFDGYDWQRTREVISQAVAEVETKAAEKQARRGKRMSLEVEEDEDSVIGDFLFNSIYIGVGNNHNPRDLARQVNRNIDDMVSETGSYTTTTATSTSESPSRQGMPKTRRSRLRLRRSKHHKMTFELKGVSADVIVFPADSGETQSSVDIRVRDLEIFDHVPSSTWKKFATYMHDAGERESGTNMIHIEILNVRPVPDLAASEIILRATVLPLRLHVDQDALDFMTRYFEFRDDSTSAPPSPSEIPFIQRAEVNAVPVKLDFKPKRIDYAGLRSGRTTEFMNFIVLDGADMVLRHVIIYGVSGFDKLGKTLNDVWMPDIKANQLPGVLAGLAPVRSLVNVGSGVRDLIVIPMREYRKDGRVMRSIQKGAFAFAKTTTTELARLGAKLAVGTQTVLQNAEGALSPRPNSSSSAAHSDPNAFESDSDDLPEERALISPYADPPIGVLQGFRGAYRHLERDLLLAKDAIVAMPGEVMDSGSPAGAARAVLRGAPTVVLRPALGVTKAVGQTLMGATSALDKGERRRIEDKYKRR